MDISDIYFHIPYILITESKFFWKSFENRITSTLCHSSHCSSLCHRIPSFIIKNLKTVYHDFFTASHTPRHIAQLSYAKKKATYNFLEDLFLK